MGLRGTPLGTDPCMSPHEAMLAWVAGDIPTSAALKLTGMEDLYDLYNACRSSDVELWRELTPTEQASVDALLALDLKL